jgi:heterodisulfide reductase subunit A
MKLEKFGEYSPGSPDVITSLEFERITNAAGPTGGNLVRMSDNRKPKSVTFIQCVGSRDVTGRGKRYCSKVCCMYTAKHAMLVKDKYPDIDVNVFYIDVRAPGKNFDEFYRRAAEEYGVNYIKGQVGKIVDLGGGLQIQGSDMLDNKQIIHKTDMVVLAAAAEPLKTTKSIASMFTASIDTNGFMSEAHPKLRPVESPTAGVFLAGMCQGPKDIPETVAQAGAAAAKVIGLLAKDKLATNPCVASVDKDCCNGCQSCEKVCPYVAITYEDNLAEVNIALCQGCGACATTCPSGAMDLLGFSNRQIIAEVDALCR